MEVIQTIYGPLHVRLYTGLVVRADREFFEKRVQGFGSPSRNKIIRPSELTLASEVYRDVPHNQIKFFSTSREEVVPYARRGAPFINTFTTREPLRLLEMQNPETHATLLATFAGRNRVVSAIQTSFPGTNGRIYRYSSPETQAVNDISLKSMCEFENVDGFYVPQVHENPFYKFHSEIGLCRKAFSKLQLVLTEKSGLSVPNNVGRGWAVGVQQEQKQEQEQEQEQAAIRHPPVHEPRLTGFKRMRLNFSNDENNKNNNNGGLYTVSLPPKPRRVKKGRVTRKNRSRKFRR